jgi:CBS domain containing-hemolysin-like protein
MLLLVFASAFFSGSETALFNLTRRQLEQFGASKNKLRNLITSLLKKPNKLLGSLLFGNMLVNILFYALSSVFVVKMQHRFGLTAAAAAAFITFIVLLLFGEILPKSLCYTDSKFYSVAVALPVSLFVTVFTPFVNTFRFLIVVPFLRLFLGPVKKPPPITENEFKSVVEHIKKGGSMTTDENRLITEIIELGNLKVRDCLRPRVDMVTCDVTRSNRSVRKVMQNNHFTKVPVHVNNIDNIIGMVHLRQLLLRPEASLDKLIQKAHFVPQQKTIESLLEFFRKSHTDTAIVVDEYGGIAGSICVEDIAEELLGPIEATGDIETIEKLGPFKFRLSGNLSIHDWADTFDIEPDETRITTIAGLITAKLGKIPKPGDTANVKNLEFTVEKVEKRRVVSVILTFKPISNNDN